MNESPAVSVIIPVFNTETYLERCLFSLRQQTLSNIEIILIDDGSTDASGRICDEYAWNEPRCTVIHKNNEGLSAARNDGLKLAHAKYIMFVDSDDWVEPEFCEIPYQIAEQNEAELVVFRRRWYRESTTEQALFPCEGIADKKDVLTTWWNLTGVIVWNKLFHRKLFEDILFPVGRLSEDTAVTHKLIYKANRVYLVNKCLYNHRIGRKDSITERKTYNFLIDERTFNIMRARDLRQWGYISREKEIEEALSYLVRVGREAEMSDYCREILAGLKLYKKNSMHIRRKAMILLLNISPKLFDFVAIKTGERINKQEEYEKR